IDETSVDEVDVEVAETPAQRQARRLHDVIPLDIAGMVAESQAPGHVSNSLYSETADHDDGLSDTQHIFIEEAQDLLVIVDGVANVGSIDELESQQGELLRVLHTLKGSARVAEFLEIGELTHVLEDVIEHFSVKNSSALTLLTGVIGEYHDSIYDAITQHPQDHDAHKNNELLARMQQLLASQDDAESPNEPIDNIVDDSAVELNESSEPYALGNVSSQEMDELKKQVEALGEIGDELDQPLLQAIDDVYLHLDSVMQVAKSIKYKKNWHNKQLLILRDISSVQSLIERQPVLSPLHNLADVFHEYITKASANNAAVRKRLVSHIQQVQVCFDASLQAAKESKEVSGQHDVVLKLRRELERFLEASPVDTILEEKVELIKNSELSEVETVEAVEEPQQNFEVESAVEQKEEQPTQPQGDKEPETPAAAKSAPAAAEQPSISSLKQRVRVPGHTLDNLANFAGDVNVTRSQMSEDLDVMKGTLDRLRENIRESSGLLRDLEIQADSGIETMRQTKTEDKYNDFDPLEMDRYNQVTQLSQNLMESLDRLTAIESELNAYVHRTETSLQQQTLTSKELMQQVLQIRLVPFSDITAQVRQTVRQTSKHLDKQVDFVIVGGDVRLDKTVLNVMLPAVDHMLRNAIDHGIESVSERKELGKPAVAMITITCEQQGKDVEVSVADDGRGLDVEKINAMAVERSLLDEDADKPDDADLNDEILLNLIAASGFTTSTQVTQISGRGIGMDVVRETLRRLGGNIQLQNRPGHGVKLTLRAPISTAVTRVMFIQAAGKEYGVPMRMVDRMVELTVEDFQQLMQVTKPLFKDQGESFHIIDLAAHLGLESKRDRSESVTVMLVYAGGHNIAVVVDEVLHSREMVVKSFGSHLSSLLAYAGAAVRADGRLTFIIDFVGLSYLEAPLEVQSDEDELEADSRLKVMVVDDSLTVRKASQNDLMKSGIDVVLASNGLDAQEQLQQGVRADLMLLDLEMPKMDGFELLQWIREQSAVPQLPVIIISSRSIDKYMDRVMQLGANDFIGKPYQLKQLLEKINQQTQNADNVEGQS
ncbi:MAG: hybrid sensor histidine kinase/response regulator, partial [Arenicella sp.]